MSYSILSTASISLALLGVATAGAAAILLCARRRHWAHRALTVMLVLFAGATASAFCAGAEGDHDLQARTRRVLSLAAVAERAAHAHSGRYVTSVAKLRRLSPALATEMRDDGAGLTIYRGAVKGTVRLRVSLGFGTPAWRTMRPPPRRFIGTVA